MFERTNEASLDTNLTADADFWVSVVAGRGQRERKARQKNRRRKEHTLAFSAVYYGLIIIGTKTMRIYLLVLCTTPLSLGESSKCPSSPYPSARRLLMWWPVASAKCSSHLPHMDMNRTRGSFQWPLAQLTRPVAALASQIYKTGKQTLGEH